jgi:hypothetical protein
METHLSLRLGALHGEPWNEHLLAGTAAQGFTREESFELSAGALKTFWAQYSDGASEDRSVRRKIAPAARLQLMSARDARY